MSNVYNLFQSKLISIYLNVSISKQMLYSAIFKQPLQQSLIIGSVAKCIDEYEDVSSECTKLPQHQHRCFEQVGKQAKKRILR